MDSRHSLTSKSLFVHLHMRFAIILNFILGFSSYLFAGVIPAQVSDTIVLTKSESPYTCGDVEILVSGRVVVNPGVTILVAPGSDITVNGTLEMNGTEGDKIKIQGNGGRMGEINGSGGSLTMVYVEMSNVSKAINISFGNCLVEHSHFSEINPGDAIGAYGTSFIFRDNYLEGDLSLAKSDAIDLAAVNGAIVERNTIVDFTDDAIDFGTSSSNVIVRNNTLKNIHSIGVSFGEGTTGKVYRNVLEDCYVGLQSHNGAHMTAYNNTIHDATTGVELFHGSQANSGGTATVINCVFSQCATLVSAYGDSTSNGTFNYCLHTSGTLEGMGNVLGDPLFISPETSNFNIQSGSPVIDAGDPDLDGDELDYSVDIDDQDVDGSRLDIGALAYELGAGIGNGNISESFSIYPMPVSSTFYVTTKSGIVFTELALINSQGKTVLNESFSVNKPVNIQDLDDGIYTLKFVGNDDRVSYSSTISIIK